MPRGESGTGSSAANSASTASNPLSKLYFGIEDKYYDFCDWLASHGIGAYQWFVEPIESKGIPSMPIALLLFLALVGGAYYGISSGALSGLFKSPQTSSLEVTVLSDANAPLSDALVSLSVEGNSVGTKRTDSSGKASFAGLPTGKSAIIRINKDGYSESTQQVLVGSQGTLVASLSAAPTPAPPSTKTVVRFLDENQQPIPGVKVTYGNPAGNVPYQTLFSQPDGTASLDIPSGRSVTLYYEATGFSPNRLLVRYGEPRDIVLASTAPQNSSEGGGGGCADASCAQPQASLSVSVTDSTGTPVESRVELYSAGSSGPLKVARTSQGIAQFDSAASEGTTAYVLAYPFDAAFVSPAKSDSIQVSAGDNSLRVTVSKRSDQPAGTLGKLTANVFDESGNPVSGAAVTLYLSGSSNALAQLETDASGTASFDVVADQSFAVTAFKDGLLPSDPVIVPAGGLLAKLVLRHLVLGNSANLSVQVLGVDGSTPVPGARAELHYADSDIPLALPAQFTDGNGVANFAPVPLGKNLKFFAIAGPFAGSSDAFLPSLTASNQYTLVLKHPTGTLILSVRNPLTNASISGANLTAMLPDGNSTGTCVTDASGTCQSTVAAGLPLTVSVAAPGFLNKTINGVIVPVGGKLTLSLKDELIPAGLANNSRLLMRAFSSDCATPIHSPDLERGKSYCVRADYNLAANQTNPNGFLVRLGGTGTTLSDPAEFTFLPDFPDLGLSADHLTLTRADSYRTDSGFSCDNAVAATTDDNSKWAHYEFNNVQGNKLILLRFLVKANATRKDRISLQYFSYAVRNGLYYRSPNDDVLALSKSAGGEDYCQANFNKTEFGVSEGNLTYSDGGGLSLAFSTSPTGSASSSLRVPVGSSFFAQVHFRLFNSPGTPALHIYTTSPTGTARSYASYVNFTTPSVTGGSGALGGTADERLTLEAPLIPGAGGVWESNATIGARALLVVPSSRVNVELVDGTNVIARVSGTLRIDGTGVLVLTASDSDFIANTPKDLKITARTTDNAPVTDTVLSLNVLDGAVFGPLYSDGDITLSGDGSQDKGLNGLYRFKGLTTLRPGTFAAVGGGTLDPRFASAQLTLLSHHNALFSVFPSSLALSCTPADFTVTNELDFSPVVVNFSFSNGCAQLAGAGVSCQSSTNGFCNAYTLSLPKGSTKTLRVMPNRSGECTLTALSSLGPLAFSSINVDTSVACQSISPTCTLSSSNQFVTGGIPGPNVTLLTASFHSLPLGVGALAQFNCGEAGSATMLASIMPSANGVDSTATSTCEYHEVGGLTQRTPVVHVVTQDNEPLDVSCSTPVNVLPPGQTGPTCLLNYVASPQSTVARLSGDFFNLDPSIRTAFFFCTPDDSPHEVPLTQQNGFASASYDCDYAQAGGLTFTAQASSGTTQCTNSSVKITPAGASCTAGAETIPFLACSQNNPWLRCTGNDPLHPSLQTDGTCCPQVLGAGATYSANPPRCTLPPSSSSTTTTTLPGELFCSDGVTAVGMCRSQPVSTRSGTVPTPWKCSATGGSTGFAIDSTCCSLQEGFRYEASTNTCVPAESTGSCTVKSGDLSVIIPYGSCSQTYVGQRCTGDTTHPALQGNTACCQLSDSKLVWSTTANACVNPNDQSIGCDPYTGAGFCQQPAPSTAASWTPTPRRCTAGTNGAAAAYSQDDSCCQLDYRGKSYQVSDDHSACVPIPPAQIAPQCTLNIDAFGPTGTGGYSGQYSITASKLNNFVTGQISVQYQCDAPNTPVQTIQDIVRGTMHSNSVGCPYDASFFNSSVVPAARITLVSGSAQQTLDCDVTGSAQVNGRLPIKGTSGQALGFSAQAFAQDIDWTKLTDANKPLGPLQGVTLIVANSTPLPSGLRFSDLTLTLACDSGVSASAPQAMQLSASAPFQWNGSCDYSSNQHALSWPVAHQPVASYRAQINGRYFPAEAPQGISAIFPKILEFAQPVASSLTATTTHLPTVADPTLSASLAASFTGMPPSSTQTVTLNCGNGVKPSAPSVAVDSKGNAQASTDSACVYSASATAKSAFDFTKLAGAQLLTDGTSNNLNVVYTAATPAPTCAWTGLPASGVIIVGGDASASSFVPAMQVSGINALPKLVEFDCGNGQTVRAQGSKIAQSGATGQAITATATAFSACAYDFSVLQQNGKPTKTATVSLSVKVDGSSCSGGDTQLTANSVDFNLMHSVISLAALDTPPLAEQVSVTVTLSPAIPNLDQLHPRAKIDCGPGSTGTAGSRQVVSLDKQDDSTYQGVGQCSYVPLPTVTVSPTSTPGPSGSNPSVPVPSSVQGVTRTVNADLTSDTGPLPNPTRPGTIVQTPRTTTPAPVAAFQACNGGILYPLIFSGLFGNAQSSSPSDFSERAFSAAQMNLYTQKLIEGGKYFVIGTQSTNGKPGFVGNAPTQQKLAVSALSSTGTLEPILIFNSAGKRETVNVDGGSCFTARGKSSVEVLPGSMQRVVLDFTGTLSSCTADQQVVLSLTAEPASTPAVITVTVTKVDSPYLTDARFSPAAGNIVVRGGYASYQAPAVVANNNPAFGVSITTQADNTQVASANPKGAAEFNAFLGTAYSVHGPSTAYALSSSPVALPAGLEKLGAFQVIGNVIDSDKVNSETACSGEDFCTQTAVKAVRGLAQQHLADAFNAVKSQLPSYDGSQDQFSSGPKNPRQFLQKNVPGYQDSSTPDFLAGYDSLMLQQMLSASQQAQNNPQFGNWMAFAGIGGGFGGSASNGQQAACTNMMACMSMMSQVTQSCSQKPGGMPLNLLPYIICSQESVQKGDLASSFPFTALLSQACAPRAPSLPKYTYSPLSSSVTAYAQPLPGGSKVLLPVRLIPANPASDSSLHVLAFTPQSNDVVKDTGTQAQLFGGNPPEAGFPYLDCSGSAPNTPPPVVPSNVPASCKVVFDHGTPTLVTLNKYPGFSLTSLGQATQSVKFNGKSVIECKYQWTTPDSGVLASRGSPSSGCQNPAQLQSSLSANAANACPKGSACVVLQTDASGNLGVSTIGSSSPSNPYGYSVLADASGSTSYSLGQIAGLLLSHLTDKGSTDSVLGALATPIILNGQQATCTPSFPSKNLLLFSCDSQRTGGEKARPAPAPSGGISLTALPYTPQPVQEALIKFTLPASLLAYHSVPVTVTSNLGAEKFVSIQSTNPAVILSCSTASAIDPKAFSASNCNSVSLPQNTFYIQAVPSSGTTATSTQFQLLAVIDGETKAVSNVASVQLTSSAPSFKQALSLSISLTPNKSYTFNSLDASSPYLGTIAMTGGLLPTLSSPGSLGLSFSNQNIQSFDSMGTTTFQVNGVLGLASTFTFTDQLGGKITISPASTSGTSPSTPTVTVSKTCVDELNSYANSPFVSYTPLATAFTVADTSPSTAPGPFPVYVSLIDYSGIPIGGISHLLLDNSNVPVAQAAAPPVSLAPLSWYRLYAKPLACNTNLANGIANGGPFIRIDLFSGVALAPLAQTGLNICNLNTDGKMYDCQAVTVAPAPAVQIPERIP